MTSSNDPRKESERRGFHAGTLISKPPCPYAADTEDNYLWEKGYIEGTQSLLRPMSLEIEELKQRSYDDQRTN